MAFCLLAFVLCIGPNVSAAQVPNIRVQLPSASNSAVVQIVQGQYSLISGTTGLPFGEAKEGQICTITKEGLNLRVQGSTQKTQVPLAGPVYFQPSGSQQALLSYNNIKYRGNLTVNNTQQGLLVVNTLPVEEYLYGVVGQEIGYGCPLEALKAQALVSRSYALNKRGTGLYADLSHGSQVYRGYDAELISGFNNVKQAVDDTAGEVVCDDNMIIDAVFHSNSGGFTESSENVWVTPLPYLRAVESPGDAYAIRYPYQNINGWPGNCYQWSVTITGEQLHKCIADWNAARPNDVINIGEVKNIILSRTDIVTGQSTASGRVTAVTLIGSLGQKVISKDSIRRFFRIDGRILKSTLFDVTLTRISSNAAAVISSITINGRGNGHGLGLSQWGARGMAAEQGANYSEIIKHYFTGVEIQKLY